MAWKKVSPMADAYFAIAMKEIKALLLYNSVFSA
jgi:hypothetical protein